MSDFFKWLGDFCPLVLWWVIWVLVLPMRFFLLVLMPANAGNWGHPMRTLYQFLAFER